VFRKRGKEEMKSNSLTIIDDEWN